MCKAIEELVAKEREEARLDHLLELISKKITKGISLEQAYDKLLQWKNEKALCIIGARLALAVQSF